MKEYDHEREELENILSVFDGKHLLNVSEVARYTGLCRKTIRESKSKYLQRNADGYINVRMLAKYMVSAK